ncbi:helix-turn-helix-type transcriptional regulator, partial [Fulvivirga sp. RKSG066]|nr:helix-turn-helix-type transcriptional regulator [Fulvivirga aurantia]
MYPFLEKIGILWLSGNITPIQEHFISNLIRQKIIVAVDSIATTQDKDAEVAVLFLPEEELHEIGLLFYHYLAKSLNYRTYYLGQRVPMSDLIAVTKSLTPKHLITSISLNKTEEEIGEFITQLSQKFPNSVVLVAGYAFHQYSGEMPKN